MGYAPVMAEPAARATTESDEQRARRLAWERARIAEADEDIAAGRVISGDEALEWLDRWAAGEDLEEPDLRG
jgi:predicted transcriptional regulator